MSGDILINLLGAKDLSQALYWLTNVGFACFSLLIALILFFRSKAIITRPAFMVAILMMVFYQWSLIPYSFVFYERGFDIWWFAITIHSIVLLNFLWVAFTPNLTSSDIYKKPSETSSPSGFKGFEIWFSLALFFILLAVYLYKVPPRCTALYSIFFDPSLALLIREITVKLIGTTYSTYALSILYTTINPIMAFLAIYMMYKALADYRIFRFVFWLVILSLVLISNLLSGAKGNLIPTFVVISVAGFLSVHKWYLRIITVVGLNAVLILILSLFGMERASINSLARKDYNFGKCVVEMGVCKPTGILLESLTARDFSLDLPKSVIASLEEERKNSCMDNIPANIVEQELPRKTNIDIAGKEIISTSSEKRNNNKDIVITKEKPSHHKTKTTKEMELTIGEKYIVNEHSKITVMDRINGIINRAFVTPLIVAHWHFLYVSEYSAPGFNGISIARRLSDNYIDMPKKICEKYETIRSGGDRTSTCTAPTSYLFTYPAYMGVIGLLLAIFLTICFDLVVSLIIRYSAIPLNYLAVGLASVSVVNFMVADFTTVMLSHGAGAAFALLMFFRIFRLL
ncbi:MAG: hypothetical protein R3D71_03080 [Rickettsiales bacterium]